MTNEKIIANIERYISTVSKEQQQHFEQALEIAEKEHKPVKKYFNAHGALCTRKSKFLYI